MSSDEPRSVRPLTKRAELVDFAARLEGVDAIAFDTEFHAEQTYWPKVMLLQFASEREAVLVDPLAPEIKSSLGGFLEMLKMRRQVLVGHALERDLEIFQRLNGGLPARIFDTQVAAAMVGRGGPIGLGALLEAELGVEVDKLYSRADWGKRPLPDAQARYALEDVTHLLALRARLAEALEARGRTAWFEQEMARALDPDRYHPLAPEQAWRRVGRKPAPGTRAAQILVSVAAERERVAQEEDRPPRRILPDDVLVDLARRAPTTAKALDAQTSRRPAPNLARYADRWVEAIRTGAEAAIQPAPPVDVVDDDHRGALDLARLVAQHAARAAGVAPWLLPNLDGPFLAVLSEPPASQAKLVERLELDGWRAELLGPPLWALIGERQPVSLWSDGAGLHLPTPSSP